MPITNDRYVNPQFLTDFPKMFVNRFNKIRSVAASTFHSLLFTFQHTNVEFSRLTKEYHFYFCLYSVSVDCYMVIFVENKIVFMIGNLKPVFNLGQNNSN